MAQQTMYSGIANSPQTELSAPITDTDVTISLVDASVLLAAPNLATIGTDETAETILYTGKSGNNLTGVTRGIEGAAKGWSIGVKIARNFTNSDYEAVRGNIGDHETRLTTEESLSQNRNGFGTTAGTGTAYTLTLSPAPTLLAGLRVTAKLHLSNTGAATLNVNGLGAKSIMKPNGSVLSAGNIKIDSVYTFVYNGTAFILQGEGGEYGTAAAAQVLTGYTIGTDAGLINGSVPNRAGDTAALASSVVGTMLKLRASNGYRDGVDDNVTITDADFIAANIRKDINLLGLVGTLEAKLYASGTANCSANTSSYTDEESAVFSAYSLSVSGIGFVPKVIISYRDGGTSRGVTTYSANANFLGGAVPPSTIVLERGSTQSRRLAVNKGTNNIVISNGSFANLPVNAHAASLPCFWEAYG
jgi:hypothetical protein